MMLQSLKERAMLEGILSVLGGALVLASRLNRDFQEDLRQRDGIAEIRTEDRSVARRYYISHGRIRIARGPHPSPDFAMLYKDVPTALEILKQGTEDASMKAIAEGKMLFDGDMAFGMWFMELLKKVGGLMKEPKKIVSL